MDRRPTFDTDGLTRLERAVLAALLLVAVAMAAGLSLFHLREALDWLLHGGPFGARLR